MRKIETKTAHRYIKDYETKMKELGIDTPEKGFTKSVGFNKKELQEWLQNLSSDTREIKIYFGIYSSTSEKHLSNLSEDKSEGRFTTILWPCNAEGEPANDDEGDEELPVNAGELFP